MRSAIISDVHGNPYALCAALERLTRQRVDNTYCLGDLVGYCMLPHETIALIRAAGASCVCGNHDLAAVGLCDTARWGPQAQRAIDLTRAALDAADRAYLRSLPASLRVGASALAVHSLLDDPHTYMKGAGTLRQQAERVRALDPVVNVMFTGHTHVPALVELTADGRLLVHRERSVALCRQSFYFVNPGSIGHPRTRDRRASYAIYDDAMQTVTIQRVNYDWRRMMSINREHGISINLRPSYLQYARGLVVSLRGAVELTSGNE